MLAQSVTKVHVAAVGEEVHREVENTDKFDVLHVFYDFGCDLLTFW